MFLYRPMLWGLLGVSVPIVIHLLNRFRHREIDWGAMALLRKALVVRSRQVRLEDILILLLRCLAVALIALAMARPALRSGAGRWFGKDAQVGVVIVLDGSYSMAHQPGVKSRFRRGLERVRQVLKTVKAGSPLKIVLGGSRLHPFPGLKDVYDEAAVERALAKAEPLPERLNLEACLQQAKALVRDLKAPARECYLVTDAQATTWGDLSDEAKVSLGELARLGKVYFLATPATSNENVAVTHFGLSGGTLRKNTMARYSAEVRNVGRKAREKITLTLLLDGQPVGRRVVEQLDPGAATTVPLFVRFDRTGDARLTVRTGHDALATDNVRHAVAHVHERLRVLCVDGDPSSRPFKSETDYLLTALDPRRTGPAGGTLEVKAVSSLDLPAQRMADYQVVVLANVPDIRQVQANALAGFVRRGGGLIIFLGDKTAARVINARMKTADGTLLPGEVGDLAEPARSGQGYPLALAAAGHPLTLPLKTLPARLLERARVMRFFTIRPAAGARVLLGMAGTDAPLLLERPVGRGNVLLFASTADRAWTNFIVHPAGPIFVHQAITYLTRRPHERQFTTGGPLAVPVRGRDEVDTITFRDPAGDETTVQLAERDGERVAELPAAGAVGFYELLQAGEARPLAAVAANVDPGESDVTTLQGNALVKALSGLPLKVFEADQGNLLDAIAAARVGVELWRYLAILALIVLAAEAYLANRFSRRMAVRDDVLPEGTPGELLASEEA